MTEWVTVKVPEADRDKAKELRPDGATHGDCLVAGAERLNDHMHSDPPPRAGHLTPDQYAEGMADALGLDLPMADIKEAMREVLREELPEGALR